MGKYQGLSCDWENAPSEIISALIDDPDLVDAFIDAVAKCPDYASANRLSEILPSIETLTPAQTSRLVSVFNENQQVGSSYGFNGINPSTHGDGLPALLSEVTGRDVQLSKDWQDRYRVQPTWFGTYKTFS